MAFDPTRRYSRLAEIFFSSFSVPKKTTSKLLFIAAPDSILSKWKRLLARANPSEEEVFAGKSKIKSASSKATLFWFLTVKLKRAGCPPST